MTFFKGMEVVRVMLGSETKDYDSYSTTATDYMFCCTYVAGQSKNYSKCQCATIHIVSSKS